jgi:HlyD family secretion protein/epimerase transport system membrane fusion protein
MTKNALHPSQAASLRSKVDVPPRPPIGRYVAGGIAVIGLLFGGLGSWAALAPLTSAAIAPGVVKVDTSSKVVQHLEGGIIRDILVRDGEAVKKGQVLVRLDDADAEADLNAIHGQIGALEAEITSTREQLPSVEEQLSDQRSLYKKGFARKPVLLDLERTVTQLNGQIAANEQRLLSLREQERKAQAKTDRNVITAPQDGVVMNVRFHTVGGVVPPGGEILDLVPDRDKLVLEVKVQPIDIDVVRPDLPATIRFVAYKQRTTPAIDGKVTRVSADTTTDEQRGSSAKTGAEVGKDAPYFLATIEVGPDQLARVPNVKLYPGMPIEAAIVTGQRTLLDFLIQPMTDSFARAFREE